jgi:hypothetical protein
MLKRSKLPPASASLRTTPLSPKNLDVLGHAKCTASFLRLPNAKFLDHRDHFRHNHPASVAALRSLIGSRRNADRLPSGTLIDFPRIRSMQPG